MWECFSANSKFPFSFVKYLLLSTDWVDHNPTKRGENSVSLVHGITILFLIIVFVRKTHSKIIYTHQKYTTKAIYVNVLTICHPKEISSAVIKWEWKRNWLNMLNVGTGGVCIFELWFIIYCIHIWKLRKCIEIWAF